MWKVNRCYVKVISQTNDRFSLYTLAVKKPYITTCFMNSHLGSLKKRQKIFYISIFYKFFCQSSEKASIGTNISYFVNLSDFLRVFIRLMVFIPEHKGDLLTFTQLT